MLGKNILELDFGIACVLVTVGQPGARATVVLTNAEKDKLINELMAHRDNPACRNGKRVKVADY